MSEAANPYAAPAARLEELGADSVAETIRREHINHEASIKAVGILYYIGGVLIMLGGFAALVGAPKDPGAAAFVMLFIAAIGVAQLVAGWGVRALKPWGRIVACVISVIGLLGFPIGTLINAYILYLLFSKKGSTVFSADYQGVIAATPHVKYKTSIVVWIFLALIVGLIVVGIGAALFSK
jgi:hypothetical protein